MFKFAIIGIDQGGLSWPIPTHFPLLMRARNRCNVEVVDLEEDMLQATFPIPWLCNIDIAFARTSIETSVLS